MDAAGIEFTRFGLLNKLLHQNEIVPFFMDEKRNVRWFSSPKKRKNLVNPVNSNSLFHGRKRALVLQFIYEKR
jgi:hypothetical protein